MKNIYFLFTTGRTGTALLAQCFGLKKWSKKQFSKNAECIVAHEPWLDIPVDKMKLVDIYSEEAFDIAEPYLQEKFYEINKTFPEANALFLTDHKIGRYFGPYIANSDLNFKIIYIERDCTDVSRSFDKKRIAKKKELDDARYKRYLQRMWSHNKYHPSDLSVINKVSEPVWLKYSFEEKFFWYAEETALQWYRLKSILSQENFLEIKLNKAYVKKDLENISKFLDIEYDKNLFNIRAN